MESLEPGAWQSVWDTEIVDYLEPSCVEEELEEGEDGNVQIQVMSRVAFGGIQELPSDQAGKEERVDSEGDDLEQRDRNAGINGNFVAKQAGGEKNKTKPSRMGLGL